MLFLCFNYNCVILIMMHLLSLSLKENKQTKHMFKTNILVIKFHNVSFIVFSL